MIRGRLLASAAAALLLPALIAPAVAQASEGPRLEPRVVNGREPVDAEVTPLVYVRIGSTLCSGTLVDPTHVVTAGHCAVNRSGTILSPAAFAIGWGSDGQLPLATWARVSRVDLHPAYDHQTFVNDIAVLTLASPIPGATPMTLATAAESKVGLARRAAVRAAGYGYTASNGLPSTRSLVGDLTVMSNRACRESERTFRIGGIEFVGLSVDTSTAVCAIGVQRETGLIVDTCQGDSGGPLYADLGAGERLLGVVSVGVGCAGFEGSDELETKTPGVYTRIAPYRPWLLDTVGVGDAPAAPRVTATPSGADGIAISFASVGTSQATGFRAVLTDPEGVPAECTASMLAPTCTVADLRPGVPYTVIGYAVGAAQDSAASPGATVIAGTPTSVPAKPRLRSAQPQGDGVVSFRVTRVDPAAWTTTLVICRADSQKFRADIVEGIARIELPAGQEYRCFAKSRNPVGAIRSKAVRFTA